MLFLSSLLQRQGRCVYVKPMIRVCLCLPNYTYCEHFTCIKLRSVYCLSVKTENVIIICLCNLSYSCKINWTEIEFKNQYQRHCFRKIRNISKKDPSISFANIKKSQLSQTRKAILMVFIDYDVIFRAFIRYCLR